MMIRLPVIVFLLFDCLVSASPVIPLSLDRLSHESQLVIHGKVISKSVQRDEAGRIFTKVFLDIREIWKGNLRENLRGDPFTMVHSGGILGDQKSWADGEVNFKIGEEVVLFLISNKRGEWLSLAMNQGKFLVFEDPISKQRFVQNPFHGGLPQSSSKRNYRLPNQIPISLSALKEKVIRK